MNKYSLVKIFKNKKVLITGHTGFKGSWLTALLLELGANIIGVSIDLKKNSHFDLLNIKKKIINIKADIRDYKKLKKIIKKYQPEFVFHLAAQALIMKSYKDPINTWSTNVMGTLNLIESLKLITKKSYAVIITSDKCYFNVEKKNGYKETDTLGGTDPYSASKASAEHAIKSEFCSYFKYSNKIRIVSARAGNVIGGGDWSDNRIIPDYMRSLEVNKKLKIRNPYATRPWQHVLEPLYGYLLLAANLKKRKNIHGQSFNFGPSKFSNKTVFDVIKELKNNLLKVKFSVNRLKKKNIDKESKLLNLNCEKAKKTLKWSSKLNFMETIKLTADWYREYLEQKHIITFKQIKNYLKSI